MKFPSSPSSGGDQTFFKIKPGETQTVVVRGEPYEFFARWEGNKSIHVREGDHGAKFKFRINLIVSEVVSGNKVMSAKVWEQGPTVYNILKEMHAEYDLVKTALKIKREGSGMDTEYTILPVRQELTPAQIKSVDAVQLQDLAADHRKEQKANAHNEPPFGDDEPPPFDPTDEIPF